MRHVLQVEDDYCVHQRQLIKIQKEPHVGNDTLLQQFRFHVPRIDLFEGKAAMKVLTPIQNLGQGRGSQVMASIQN